MGKKKPRLWPPVPQRGAEIFDNHTHLPLAEDEYVVDDAGDMLYVSDLVQRAQQSGVSRIIASACSLQEILQLRKREQYFSRPEFRSLRFAVAIHPNDAPHHAGILDTGPDNMVQQLGPGEEVPLDQAMAEVEAVARNLPSVVAIGETGLDYYRTAVSGRQVQQQSFAAHIELAKSLDLPLQIHDRQAHADCLEILDRVGAPRRTVFHCFSGDTQLADIFNSRGYYASFAGNVTYPSNQDIQQGFVRMDPSLRLIETDAPYLTPIPWRGHPNASYLIQHTAQFLAELVGVDVAEICRQTFDNAARVYPGDEAKVR